MAQQTYDDARKTLTDLLSNLSFVKVVSLQKNAAGAYTGEASDLFKKEMVFFDKFGRSRMNLTIGPITLVQAALGFDHPSSVPSVGEILVGTSVPNTRKSHLTGVLRGWSSDAKPLYELLRILKFGTKKSEFDNRSLLIQQGAIVGGHQKYRDEIYMLARMVLWKNVRPVQVLTSLQDPLITLREPASEPEVLSAKSTYLSVPARTFVEIVSIKLSAPEILDAYLSGLHLPVNPMTCVHTFVSSEDREVCSTCKTERFRPKSPEVAGAPLHNIYTASKEAPKEAYSPRAAPIRIPPETTPVAYNPTSPGGIANPSYNPTSPTYSLESFDD
jgi:hypothetical protein